MPSQEFRHSWGSGPTGGVVRVDGGESYEVIVNGPLATVTNRPPDYPDGSPRARAEREMRRVENERHMHGNWVPSPLRVQEAAAQAADEMRRRGVYANWVMTPNQNSWDDMPGYLQGPLGLRLLKPRPSSLPMYMACRQSHLQVPGEPRVELTGDEPAELGTAVHILMDHYHRGASYEECMRRAVMVQDWHRTSVNPEDAAYLFQQGVKMFEEERHTYQYRPEPGFLLACEDFEGTPDVYAVSDTTIKVGDYKSGWGMTPAYDQVMGYLWLLNQAYPGRERFQGDIYYLRHDRVERIDKTHIGLLAWHAGYLAKINDVNYRITEHCQNCKRVLSCPAIKAAASSLALMRTTLGGPMLRNPADDSLLASLQYTIDAAKAVKRVCDAVDTTKEAIVEQSGGQLTLPDGRELRRTIRYRKEFNAALAVPVLQELLGTQAVEEICKLSVASITRAVKRFMPGRPVRPIMRSIMERLANADAVQEVPYTVIRQQDEPEEGE